MSRRERARRAEEAQRDALPPAELPLAEVWGLLDEAWHAQRVAARPVTERERAAAHIALDRMLDVDPAVALWLLTRSRVALEDTLTTTGED